MSGNRKIVIDFKKILPFAVSILLFVVLFIRMFSYKEHISDYIGLSSSIISSKLLTFIVLLGIWLEYTAVLIVVLRPFFEIKTIKNSTKYITPFIFVANLFLLKPSVLLLTGQDNTLLTVLLIIEEALGLVISIYYYVKEFKTEEINYKSILVSLGIFGAMMLASMPVYFPQFVFGLTKLQMIPKSLTPAHRILLYGNILFPVALYFLLRNKSQGVINCALIYISLATLIGYLLPYNYQTFSEPWTWPFHLCNTAMFIIPICLVFKMKRLFYFTYFINVLGALLAMLMPNYGDINILQETVCRFWYNHWIAFFMPLLAVALKRFKRPTIKEFAYSMLWFFCYFVLALVLNVVFTALGHSQDYFFINSPFVAEKLGTWAENLFKINWKFELFGIVFELHPIYQGLYFLVYVLLGLSVWFVYAEFFRIADRHFQLHEKLKKIKIHEYARKSVFSKREKEKMMSENITAKLELKHFSKRYASSKVFAVKDASLEIHEGEIFGFLGPNGAGKSTIIKSMVGIQPVTDGEIDICGYSISDDPVKAKSNIGYVPDHYALYEKLSGREYINYIADIYEVSLEDRNARIEKYIKLFELESSIDAKIATYSHGMKQKITIMAALVHNPKVWILDEPLTGLDPNSIFQVKECMKQHAAEGNIVFFSSHIIDIVEKLCERIAIIKKGHIKCVKTLKEIEESGTTLEKFYMDIINGSEEIPTEYIEDTKNA